MSLIKQIKLEDNLYDIGAKWSNIDKENIVYEPSEIVSFENNTIEPLKKCIINIKAVQEGSGDTSPENVRPITGFDSAIVFRAGKNLFDKNTATNQYIDSDGLIFDASNARLSGYIPINGVCTCSVQRIGTGTDNVLRVAAYDANRNFLYRTLSNSATEGDYNTVTINDQSAKYIRVGIFTGSQDVNTMQVEFGASRTSYESFTEPSYFFDWSDKAGTVYGGTLDVLTGVLTVDRVCKTLIGTDIQARSSYITSAGDYRFYSTADASQDILLPLNAQTAADILCSVAVAIPHGDSSLYGVSVNRLDSRIYLHIQECGQMTLEEFRTWIDNHNVQVVYKIITPIIYQLSPQIIFTLLGNNNIWADCGDISIELENFYSDIQNEITTNLNENTLLYNKNYNLTTSNNYITNDKISINSLNYYDNYNLYINGSTLTNGHIVLKNDGIWHASGDNSEPSFQMIGKNDKRFKFKFSNSGTNVDIGWDWTLMGGSGAFFRTSDATSNPGGFGFFARKPNTTTPTTADCSELYGYPNGLLFWRKSSGDSNPRFAINATSSNYTLYVNGTTYLKGDTKISANTSTVGCTLQYDDTLNTLNFVFD